MVPSYELSAQADNDLAEIWSRIAEDSVDLADRIDDEFHALFSSLARAPGQGHTRKDLTNRPVRFFSLYSFLVVYLPVKPLRIVAVVRGRRNVKRILRQRT